MVKKKGSQRAIEQKPGSVVLPKSKAKKGRKGPAKRITKKRGK